MKDDTRRIEVDLALGADVAHVGSLYFVQQKGVELASFEYASSWLSSDVKFSIDPELQLSPSRQYPEKGLFGCFQDASPDRWGRNLIQRDYKRMLEENRGRARTLPESAYLMSVADMLRMGALRFREGNVYQAPLRDGVPKLEHLSAFYEKIRRYQENREENGDLRDILDPGSSLGGARPKLALTDAGGKKLFIGKFPSVNDRIDNPLWEKVSLDLAQNCGLRVPSSRLASLPDRRHALIVERFDRKDGARIHFVSAMTLLGARDGEQDHGYLDLAEQIQADSVCPGQDLEEMWKRLLFNVLTCNRDDHLRNHGFLRLSGGWQLSPVYDLESDCTKAAHSLALDENGDREPNPKTVLDVSEYFGISQAKAFSMFRAMSEEIAQWKRLALRYGATASDISEMSANYTMFAGQRLHQVSETIEGHSPTLGAPTP